MSVREIESDDHLCTLRRIAGDAIVLGLTECIECWAAKMQSPKVKLRSKLRNSLNYILKSSWLPQVRKTGF